jgi:hypothetical protein
MYSGDWTPTDAAGSGWGPEEDQALATIYAGMDADAKRLFDNQVLGSKMRGEIRQKILEARAPQKQKELNTDFEYGGDPGKAAADAAYFRAKAEAAQNRQGERIDTTRGDEWRLATQMAREGQRQALGLMEQRARGLVPSIASQQAALDIGRGIADQSSIQAGARGAAGLALAQQQAANNSATLTSRISNDAQVNAAKERADAEQAWFGGLSGMRGQDTQSQTVDLQTAQAQAEINAQQRAQNDSYSQGMYGNEIGINQSQLAAHGNRQSLKAGQQIAAQQVQAAAQARADAQRDRVIGMIGQGVSSGLSAIGTGLSKSANSFRGSDGSETWRSDERVKSNAVSLGYAAGLMANPDGDPIRTAKASAWDEGNQAALNDAKKLAGVMPAQLKDMADKGHPLAGLVRDMRANAWDEGHRAPQAPQQPQASAPDPYARLEAQARESMARAAAQNEGLMQQGPAVRGGDFTAQIADGLAPTRYDYKPGMGPSGTETGIIAQNAARNPLTAGAVHQDGQGLLALDPARSVKLSLAAAGNNAQEIQRIKQQLASFSGRGLYGGSGPGGF